MDWMNQIGGVLKQYEANAAGAEPGQEVQSHFDDVAKAAPAGTLAEGLAAAFRSDQTPAVGEMVSTLFSKSTAEQKAGLLNQLIGAVNPGTLTQILSSGGASGLTGLLPGANVTPEQAQQIPPDVVQQIATHAEKSSPSVVDSLSSFYAQHSTLVKTLGGTALTIALAKIAERQK